MAERAQMLLSTAHVPVHGTPAQWAIYHHRETHHLTEKLGTDHSAGTGESLIITTNEQGTTSPIAQNGLLSGSALFKQPPPWLRWSLYLYRTFRALGWTTGGCWYHFSSPQAGMLRDVDSSGWPDEEVLIPCISGAAGWTYVCCVVVCVCVCMYVWMWAKFWLNLYLCVCMCVYVCTLCAYVV